MTAGRSSLVAASFTTGIVCLLLQATASSQASQVAGFDAYVAKAVQEWRTPGLAVAVVEDGRVVFSKGYGVRELGKPEPVDTHTLFAIGSTTKAMTAALVGMLVDDGKLGWDDPVVKHLPWFQVKDPYLTREITVRDLLTHAPASAMPITSGTAKRARRGRFSSVCDCSSRPIRCDRRSSTRT
jgi:CubicO group peptidase (beta-lactamase class C family)